MTTEAQPAEPSDALSREAAEWFARMRGPEAEAARPRFEAWLASDAGHRSAYNRAAEIFAMGKLLAEAEETPPPRRSRLLTPALATCALATLVIGGWAALYSPQRTRPPTELAAGSAHRAAALSTMSGETRSIRLADGSTLTLGSDSAVEAAFDPGSRRLRLLRGRARFEVAHERRPFTVLAGGGSVTARGTVFEVALATAGRVDVRLIEGAIDVALPRRDRTTLVVRRLGAGERMSFAVPTAANGAAPPSPARAGIAALTVRDYQGVTVAALIADANRGAARPIRLADPTLGTKRISGRFRIDDTALLAARLAALFDGKAKLGDEREIVLAP